MDRRLAFDLELFSRGGMRVLDKIEQQDYNVLAKRPQSRSSSACSCCWAALLAAMRAEISWPVSLAESYAFCRKIARTRARNFYYSFLLLSRDQKNAMCAIYAFMRFCDDLSDEQGASLAAIDAMARRTGAALAGPVRRSPALAGIPRRGAALQHPAPIFSTT